MAISPINLDAQLSDEAVSAQGWIDYNASYNINNNFDVYGDMGYRIISPDVWTRYYIRPAVNYTISSYNDRGRRRSLAFHAGVGLFYTDNTNIPNHTELRPFQGVNIRWPYLRNIKFNHYFRLEERFEFTDNMHDFGMRARYMFAGNVHLIRDNWGRVGNIYIPFHIELFWNLATTSQFNDLIRITPGLGYEINLHLKTEFSASYHRTRNTAGGNFETNAVVFRLRLFHDIF